MKYILTITFGLILSSTFYLPHSSHAWTGPSSAPPEGDVDAPVTTGIINQEKSGGLRLGKDPSTTIGAWVDNGLLIVGAVDPTDPDALIPDGGKVAYFGGDIIAKKICLGTATTCWDSIGGGSINGSGTENSLTKWGHSGLTVVDSNIMELDTKIGLGSEAGTYINTTNKNPLVSIRRTGTRVISDTDIPANATLHVSGGTSAGYYPFVVENAAGTSLVVNAAGNVGIGISAPTAAKLQVQGNVTVSGGDITVTGSNKFVGNGSLITNLTATQIPSLDASKITSGVFSASRLGSGTANSNVYLRGDSTWAAPVVSTFSDGITITGSGSSIATPLKFKDCTSANPVWKWASGAWVCGSDATGITSITAGTGLSGGTLTQSGTIAIANNGVGTTQLADGAVTNAKLTTGISITKLSSTTADVTKYLRGNGTWDAPTFTLADNSVTSIKILNGEVKTDDIATGAVTNVKILDVDASKITGSIATTKLTGVASTNSGNYLRGNGTWDAPTFTLADNSVTSIKILNGEVKTDDIATGAVTNVKILDVDASKITGSIATTKLTGVYSTNGNNVLRGDGTWGVPFVLNDNSITNQKMADNAIDTAEIVDGAVTARKLADGAVESPKIATAAVTNDKIAVGTISVNKLAGAKYAGAYLRSDGVWNYPGRESVFSVLKYQSNVFPAVSTTATTFPGQYQYSGVLTNHDTGHIFEYFCDSNTVTGLICKRMTSSDTITIGFWAGGGSYYVSKSPSGFEHVTFTLNRESRPR